MLECDYMDDLRRPGVVIGPKTLPRTANRLLDEGYEDVLYRTMKDMPERVFGIEI
jgi:TatD-related deoxyribonuclease